MLTLFELKNRYLTYLVCIVELVREENWLSNRNLLSNNNDEVGYTGFLVAYLCLMQVFSRVNILKNCTPIPFRVGGGLVLKI